MLKFIVFFLTSSLCSITLAQSNNFDLDEFESDIKGGIKEEKEKEKAAEQKTETVKAEDEKDGDVEKIQVTGSHIKKSSLEGVSPIHVLDRAVMERSGYNSVSDVLRDMGQSSFGGTREQSGNNAAGSSSVNLRGLGSNKTLVLLNGKRLPIDAVTGSVDLNLVPMAAVQRIEVLTDGASATYGSDALGGVVNIITLKDYNGTQVQAQTTVGSEIRIENLGRNNFKPKDASANVSSKFKGAETKEASVITGSATSKSSIVTVINYRENSSFFSRDRPWSDNGYSTFGSPGSFKDNSGVWKPDPACPSGDVEDFGGGSSVCRFKFSDYSTELPDLKQVSGMTLFEYETDHSVTLFGRFNASRKLVNWQYAPAVGIFNIPAATAATLGLGGTYTGGDVLARYRTVELGNRVQDVETTSLGYQLGAKGSVSPTWDWELTLDQNRVRNISIGVSGYALSDRVDDLISSGDFNPFGTAGSKGDISSAAYQPWQSSVSENTMTELKFSGEIANLPAGAIGGAIGAVTTYERYKDEVDKLSENGDVFGSSGSSGGGDRSTKSVYAETSIPVFKGLEFQVAGRHDQFSDFGNTTNPKIGLKWDITQHVMLRASAGTGFKAPNLTDMYAASSEGNPTFVDEVACKQEQQNTPNSTPSCTPRQYLVRSGGNKDLEEERSKSYNVGLMIQPNKKMNFGFDLWQTKLTNVVAGDIYKIVTQAEAQGINVSQYGVDINRDSNGYIDPSAGKGIYAPLLNLSSQEVSGIDINFSQRFDFGLSVSMNHAHLFYFKEESFPGLGFENILRQNEKPAWRNTINLTFQTNKNSFSLLGKTIGSHEKLVREEGELPRYTEFDFSYNRQLLEKTSLTFGIQNVLGTIPPLDKSNPNKQLATALYSPRGQLAFIGIKQGF